MTAKVAAYLPELSYTAIDPQRVRGDAGNPIAGLAELPQRGGARRRAGVQRAATAGATTRGRFRLRALPYYAGVGRRGDQHRRRRRLTRAAVVAALHALSSETENIARGIYTHRTRRLKHDFSLFAKSQASALAWEYHLTRLPRRLTL